MNLEIGKLCQYECCGVKDFLPLKCKMCTKFFCKNHYTNHLCINIKKQENVKKKPNIYNKKSKKFICSLKNCNEKSYIKFNCFHCNKHYCLKHKYTDLHECKKNIKK